MNEENRSTDPVLNVPGVETAPTNADLPMPTANTGPEAPIAPTESPTIETSPPPIQAPEVPAGKSLWQRLFGGGDKAPVETTPPAAPSEPIEVPNTEPDSPSKI